jgi:hypothetical protein
MFIVLGAFILSGTAFAQVPMDLAVQLHATMRKTPPQIRLSWPLCATAGGYAVYRKPLAAAGWGHALATTAGDATGYVDAQVVLGSAYEYQVVRGSATMPPARGYLASGIELPLVEQRGSVILLVDAGIARALSRELARLMLDLNGDGWTVLRHDVPASSSPAQIKALILQDYAADPRHVKSLFLFGHLPVVRSGWIEPDYDNYWRPFPTDFYYSVLPGRWTDTRQFGGANKPGDGIFDQSTLPEVSLDAAPVTLESGRVDMADLPTFDAATPTPGIGDDMSWATSEVGRLRNYLNKDHQYRMKAFAIQRKAFVSDGFGMYGGPGFAQVGWMNFAPLCPPGMVTTDTWKNPATRTPYLWAYASGPGNNTGAASVGETKDLLTADPAVFTMLFGSFFVDWEVKDDFMRAELATRHYGLTCCWGSWPSWYIHRMGIGESIGASARLTENNLDGVYFNYQNIDVGAVHQELCGDPTLRLTMVAPVQDVRATRVGARTVHLTWNPSPDGQVLGYHVYRMTATSATPRRVNATLLKGTHYDDHAAPAGADTYFVRAVKLETSTSSSYYNASIGVPTTVTLTRKF